MSLNWPAAALIFGLIALLAFRRQLGALLERTEKIKDWLVAPRQSSEVQESVPNEQLEQKAYERLTRGLDNQLLVLQDRSIEEALAVEGLKVQTATERVLVRHLSGVQLALRYERLSGVIYASQIRALRWLNSQTKGVDDESLRPFYDFAAKHFPPLYSMLNFETWFDFLVRHDLITDPDNQTEVWDGYQITHVGRGYLRYLVDTGRVEPNLG